MYLSLIAELISFGGIVYSILLLLNAESPIETIGGVFGVLLALASIFLFLKDTFSCVCVFRQDGREMCRYKKREDADELSKLNQAVTLVSESPFERKMAELDNGKGVVRVDYADLFDFVYCYPAITRRLLDGWRFVGKLGVDTELFYKIHSQIDTAMEALSLRKKATKYNNFYNEDKINFVGNPIVDDERKVIILAYAKSCYYASYLTAELYRDQVFENGSPIKLGDWNPFERSTSGMTLPAFDGSRSLHLGVNTLVVTDDGYVLLWQQGKGARSTGLVAPSGSGSMDYGDILAALKNIKINGYDDFNSVISFAAERELNEEMFGARDCSGAYNLIRSAVVFLPRIVLQMIGACRKKFPKMETRVIGMYRWGAIGGLPGFVCVTRINCSKSYLVDHKMISLSEGYLKSELSELKLECSKENGIREIDNYVNLRKDRYNMSLPLRVALLVLKEALLVGNQEFNKWVIADYGRVGNT